jgi:TonB family protein
MAAEEKGSGVRNRSLGSKIVDHLTMTRKLSTFAVAIALLLPGMALPGAGAWAEEAAAGPRPVKRKVMPEYPAIAKRMKLTGKVRLRAVIAADGHVVSTKVIGGHPVLVESAQRALKDWRFSPAAAESSQDIEMEFAASDVR